MATMKRESLRTGVGFFGGAGIPKGKRRSNIFVECGCCSHYHRSDFWGDCRENSERFSDVPSDALVITSDEYDEMENA